MNRLSFVSAAALAIALSTACGGQQSATTEPPAQKAEPATSAQSAPPPAGKEHVFRGKVERVDTTAKTLTVAGENVEGWMGAMTMTYSADKPDVVDKVKAGDQITARVVDGDFSTLHDVQVVPAK
jgi:Cu/Ag efflux protein CusF